MKSALARRNSPDPGQAICAMVATAKPNDPECNALDQEERDPIHKATLLVHTECIY